MTSFYGKDENRSGPRPGAPGALVTDLIRVGAGEESAGPELGGKFLEPFIFCHFESGNLEIGQKFFTQKCWRHKDEKHFKSRLDAIRFP